MAKKWKRQLVDFRAQDEDKECAIFGALGLSSNFIARETGLTPGQIGYRLRKAEISRMDFRNGRGPWAKLALGQMRETVEPNLSQYLIKYSPKPGKRETEYARRHPKASPRKAVA